MTAESTLVEGTVRESSIRGMIETAGESRAGPHATRMHAAADRAPTTDMRAATMAGEATATMHSTAADMASSAMPAPTLCPHGHSE